MALAVCKPSCKYLTLTIYQDKSLQASLAFKGETCFYFFYDLDRFSANLDFNLLSDDFDAEKMTEILSKYLTLEDLKTK